MFKPWLPAPTDEWLPRQLRTCNGDGNGDGGGFGGDGGWGGATTGGGDWGSSGAYDASWGSAGNFDVGASLAFDAMMGGLPGVSTGPGEWGSWGDWAFAPGNDLTGNFASFNAPGGPFGLTAQDVGLSQTAGGDWGSSGLFSAAGQNIAPSEVTGSIGPLAGPTDEALGVSGAQFGYGPYGSQQSLMDMVGGYQGGGGFYGTQEDAGGRDVQEGGRGPSEAPSGGRGPTEAPAVSRGPSEAPERGVEPQDRDAPSIGRDQVYEYDETGVGAPLGSLGPEQEDTEHPEETPAPSPQEQIDRGHEQFSPQTQPAGPNYSVPAAPGRTESEVITSPAPQQTQAPVVVSPTPQAPDVPAPTLGGLGPGGVPNPGSLYNDPTFASHGNLSPGYDPFAMLAAPPANFNDRFGDQPPADTSSLGYQGPFAGPDVVGPRGEPVQESIHSQDPVAPGMVPTPTAPFGDRFGDWTTQTLTDPAINESFQVSVPAGRDPSEFTALPEQGDRGTPQQAPANFSDRFGEWTATPDMSMAVPGGRSFQELGPATLQQAPANFDARFGGFPVEAPANFGERFGELPPAETSSFGYQGPFGGPDVMQGARGEPSILSPQQEINDRFGPINAPVDDFAGRFGDWASVPMGSSLVSSPALSGAPQDAVTAAGQAGQATGAPAAAVQAAQQAAATVTMQGGSPAQAADAAALAAQQGGANQQQAGAISQAVYDSLTSQAGVQGPPGQFGPTGGPQFGPQTNPEFQQTTPTTPDPGFQPGNPRGTVSNEPLADIPEQPPADVRSNIPTQQLGPTGGPIMAPIGPQMPSTAPVSPQQMTPGQFQTVPVSPNVNQSYPLGFPSYSGGLLDMLR